LNWIVEGCILWV